MFLCEFTTNSDPFHTELYGHLIHIKNILTRNFKVSVKGFGILEDLQQGIAHAC